MKKNELQEGLGDLAHAAERDHEVQMARADLYKLAKYAIKLHDMLKNVSEAEGIEGWKQAKITTAADDISSVYHAMDYDQKFAESKKTENVLKRTKTTTEVDYTASLAERVSNTLKKSLK
jgi:peptide methionine sulfoxide reductase MsrA